MHSTNNATLPFYIDISYYASKSSLTLFLLLPCPKETQKGQASAH